MSDWKKLLAAAQARAETRVLEIEQTLADIVERLESLPRDSQEWADAAEDARYCYNRLSDEVEWYENSEELVSLTVRGDLDYERLAEVEPRQLKLEVSPGKMLGANVWIFVDREREFWELFARLEAQVLPGD